MRKWHWLRYYCAGSSSPGMDPKVIVTHWLKMSQHHHAAVKNAGIVLKCLHRSMACTTHEIILLYPLKHQ